MLADLIGAPSAADRDRHARHRQAARRDPGADRRASSGATASRSSVYRPAAEACCTSSPSTANGRCTTASSCARPAARSARSSRSARAGRPHAWITGQRREQSQRRAARCAIQDRDDAGRLKLNPLADWRWADVWQLHRDARRALQPAARPGLSVHRLRPCTRAIAAGEDVRAGRWWWERTERKECGLHVARRQARAKQSRGLDRSRMNAPDTLDRLLPGSTTATSTGSSRKRSSSCASRRPNASNPALLFSGGKDSVRRAAPGREGVPPGHALPRFRCCTSTPATTSPK